MSLTQGDEARDHGRRNWIVGASSSRPIVKIAGSFVRIPGEPFIESLATDSKPLGDCAHRFELLQGGQHQTQTLFR